MKLKPPSEDVTKLALGSILADIGRQLTLEADSVEDLRQSGAMKEIDNELALLDLASRSFLAEVNTRILRLKSRQSALSAMHRLPVELLVKIFRSVSSPISIGELLSDELIPLEDLETPHVLSSACKAWKAVCESTLTYGPWLTPVNGRRDGENH